MSQRRRRYRRTAFLVAYWDEGRLVLRNSQAGTRATVSPALLDVLACFDDWQPADVVAERLPAVGPALAVRAVRALVRHRFLEAEKSPGSKVAGPSISPALPEGWRSWAPEAALFHLATRDVTYVEREDDPRLPPSPVTQGPLRPPSRPASGTGTVRLRPVPTAPGSPPGPGHADALMQVLLSRRTWRRFGRGQVSLDDLGRLLHLTWGVQSWVTVDDREEAALKTSPSGGARHSIEAYLLVLRVAGLGPGLYRYQAARHVLEPVGRRGVTGADVGAYLPAQPWYRGAAAIVFMTSVFERVQARYPYPRAYRAVVAEAGHLCQTFLLAATALGLAPFCTMALADSRIERDLGIDGLREAVLYAAGVGLRPRGVDWAPRPAGVPVPPRRPAASTEA